MRINHWFSNYMFLYGYILIIPRKQETAVKYPKTAGSPFTTFLCPSKGSQSAEKTIYIGL